MIKNLCRVAAFTLGALVGASLAASPAAAEAPAPEQSTARFEVDFLMDMIDHHAMAVEMADMCLEKAVHEDLRSMCGDIKSSQSQEISVMQSWLLDWYGVGHEPEMKPGDMRQMERLASLSGAEFEIEFMEMMIKHHQKAVGEGERCIREASHPDLVTLCENIVATQSAEIAQMEQWLCQWYGRCREHDAA